MKKKQKTGGNTGSVEYSKSYSKRMAARRRKEERSWAARSGPVTVYKVDPDQSQS